MTQPDNFYLWAPFRDELITQLSENFLWSSPHFLSPEQIMTLLKWAKQGEKKGILRPASIGKGQFKKKVTTVRTDKIFWITDFESAEGQLVSAIFEGLKIIARRDFYLSAKRYECHFAKYEKGSFYKLHRDRHSKKPGRLLSCVIYLTDNEEGGQLTIFDKEMKQTVIRPEAGKIIVFDSSLQHEVATSLGDRWSLTGWIRSDIDPNIRL